jgi:hypothetical protein
LTQVPLFPRDTNYNSDRACWHVRWRLRLSCGGRAGFHGAAAASGIPPPSRVYISHRHRPLERPLHHMFRITALPRRHFCKSLLIVGLDGSYLLVPLITSKLLAIFTSAARVCMYTGSYQKMPLKFACTSTVIKNAAKVCRYVGN